MHASRTSVGGGVLKMSLIGEIELPSQENQISVRMTEQAMKKKLDGLAEQLIRELE